MDNIAKQILKKYTNASIVTKFPESGQKSVYLITTDEHGSIMLKVIKEMNERIKREIDIVNQNNIVGVPKVLLFDSVLYNGEEYYYILEEYVCGQSLSEYLKKGVLSLDESLKLMEYLLKAVCELEKIGIVHRDIKPDNILRDNDGEFHLIDFGIARNLNLSSLTYTAIAVGPHTPGYGAPELFQYQKQKINSKADLFSIGVVIYESIFGQHPFVTGREFDVNEIWYKTATVTPRNFNIPGDDSGQLMGLIQTLMQKQPSKRPPSANKALDWFYAVEKTLSI